jgi:hypothetical protein
MIIGMSICLRCGESFYPSAPKGAMNALSHHVETAESKCPMNKEEWLEKIRVSLFEQSRG